MNQLTDKDGALIPLQSMDDWTTRRQAAFEAMHEVMGPMPGDEKRSPLDVQIVEDRDCGLYIRQLITYASEPDSRTPAYLLTPKAALLRDEPTPAVLCLHGASYLEGHRSAVNPDGRGGKGYGIELAERGYVVLAPAYPLLVNYRQRPERLGYQSATMKAIWDNMRGLDYLDALPHVRSGKYAAIGASLGGHNTLFTAAFDERIKVAVSGCGFDSFQHYRNGDITIWAGDCYMPKLKDYELEDIPFDFHDVLATIAPRRCFVSAPTDDFFRWDSAKWCVDSARAVYELYDASEHLVLEHPDCAHAFPKESRLAAYRMIDEYFNVDPIESIPIPMYQVDAFADDVFSGNPAAVCLLDSWLDDQRLQAIAAENNLAETAFIVPRAEGFDLRWFTPVKEVALCGHATLAAAHVLFACRMYAEPTIRFHTRWEGVLTVTRQDGQLEMDFPVTQLEAVAAPDGLAEALGVDCSNVFAADADYMIILPEEAAIRQVAPDMALLSRIDCRGIIVTAEGQDADFVSRFFAPRYGIPEDPVTGSAHCALTPYWAERLGKTNLRARQLSSRGGALTCRMNGDRVTIAGQAVSYLSGTITV